MKKKHVYTLWGFHADRSFLTVVEATGNCEYAYRDKEYMDMWSNISYSYKDSTLGHYNYKIEVKADSFDDFLDSLHYYRKEFDYPDDTNSLADHEGWGNGALQFITHGGWWVLQEDDKTPFLLYFDPAPVGKKLGLVEEDYEELRSKLAEKNYQGKVNVNLDNLYAIHPLPPAPLLNPNTGVVSFGDSKVEGILCMAEALNTNLDTGETYIYLHAEFNLVNKRYAYIDGEKVLTIR